MSLEDQLAAWNRAYWRWVHEGDGGDMARLAGEDPFDTSAAPERLSGRALRDAARDVAWEARVVDRWMAEALVKGDDP